MPKSAYLQTLLQLDKSSPQFASQLRDVLEGKDFDEHVSNLEDKNLVEVIDYLDKALDDLGPTNIVFRKVLRKLQKICTSRMRIPSSHILLPDLLNIDKNHFASGGYSDVFHGTYGSVGVCVKKLRVASTDDPERVTKMLHRETLIWKRLIHDNIVPFIGVTFDPLQIISEWMSGGDLTAHIKSNPDANRIALLIGVAAGLRYLHQCDVVHGDLKGPNIMVDADGSARITDFGLAEHQGAAEETDSTTGGTARWTAPEILNGQGTLSKRADVFSFAMVMVEVFTGSAPFDLHLSITVALAIMRGERPLRPTHSACTSDVWTLMQSCWNQEPRLRPDMSEVLHVLRNQLTPLSLYNQTFVNLIFLLCASSQLSTRRSSPGPHHRTFSVPSPPKSNYGSGADFPRRHKGAGRSLSHAPSPNPAILEQSRRSNRPLSEFHDQSSNMLRGGTGGHRTQSTLGGRSTGEDLRLDLNRGPSNQDVEKQRSAEQRNNFGAPGERAGKPEREGQIGPDNTRGRPIEAPDTIEKKPWWKSCC